MTTLTEFLLARIGEDHLAARLAAPLSRGWVAAFQMPPSDPVGKCIAGWTPYRILEECEAKRQIVALHPCDDCGTDDPCATLRFLGSPYVDHPDYRDEWRP